MNKRYLQIISTLSFFLFFLSVSAQAQVNDKWYADNQEAIDSLRKGNFVVHVLDENNNFIEAEVSYSLKNHEFPWGTALNISSTGDDAWYKATARKYFNQGVPENAFKWSEMQPNPGPVNYNDVNRYVDFCDEAGWELRGHTLLWGSKNYDDFHPLQKWVKDLPVPDMYDTCKVRVQREMEYYKDIITEYDVINEALPGHADWLQQTVGDSVNWNAFKWARETDPNAKLYINDYSIIAGSDFSKYIELIQGMLDNGAPIDGIGVQGHFGSKFTPATVNYILDSLATLGLPIKVTEFDMQVGDNNMSEETQAKYYALAMRTCFAHPAVNGFLFWGFWDSRHWRDKAGIFTDAKTPKIAADSVFNLLHTTWTTQGFQTVSSTLPLEVNGYYGDYELEINYQGVKRVVEVELNKENEGEIISVSLASSKLPSPKIIGAYAYADNSITLQFDTKMSAVDAEEDFDIISSDSHRISQIWQPEDDSTLLVLELKDNIDYRDYLTVSYFSGNVKATNGASLEFIGAYEIINHIPGFISGTTNDEGSLVELEFSKDMATPDNADLNSFAITVNDVPAIISEIGLVDEANEKLYLKLKDAVLFGQKVKVSYTPGTIVSAGNGVLAEFGAKLIANAVPVGINNEAFDKNHVLAYYNNNQHTVTLSNQSGNQQNYNYKIYNTSGIMIFSGRINFGEDIYLDASALKPGLLIVRFESLKMNISNTTKLIIE